MDSDTKAYIDQQIFKAVSAQMSTHRHSGTDSQRIGGSSLISAPQPSVTSPSGGGTAGVDSSARASINQIISVLKNLGLTS